MNITEFNKIKDLTYLEYCDYLQKKYGIGKYNYMTKAFNKVPKVSRTSEGLIAHHKYEDHAIMLCKVEVAKKNPYDWQLAENIIYCDYLEHLYLHVLICRYPSSNKSDNQIVGIGGVVNFIAPELNDVYSGFKTKQAWRENCYQKIINDKDVYLIILKEFLNMYSYIAPTIIKYLCRSFNQPYGQWVSGYNDKLYSEIKSLLNMDECLPV